MEPEFMLETAEFAETLNEIGESVTKDFSEDEVQMTFLHKGYFQLLGYDRIGTDLRSEYNTGSGYVDYITTGRGATLSDTRTVVYEFKKPQNKPLENYRDQLSGYMDDVRAEYGVLTDGIEFFLYQNKPGQLEKKIGFYLESAGEGEASAIIMGLGYWSIEEQNIRPVAEKTAKEVANEIPENLHIDFSEAGVELFATHLAQYLKEEFQKNHRSN